MESHLNQIERTNADVFFKIVQNTKNHNNKKEVFMAVRVIDFGMNMSWSQVKITALGSELKYIRYRNTCSLTDHGM